MTDDEAVAVYQQAYTTAQRAADDFDFMLYMIAAVAANFRQWRGKTFRPDAVKVCLDGLIPERRLRAEHHSLKADWPKTTGHIHSALTDAQTKRKAAGLAWISVPEDQRSSLKPPKDLDS
jgi:hypothetical protein